jgi:hypothetical protein
MQVFKDDAGREWSIKITGPVVEDVRKRFKLDLVSWETPPFERLAADPELLVNLLWFLVESQATAASVTARQFGESMGDAIDAAQLALCEATNDFFPSSKRSLRRSLLEKTAAVGIKVGELALAKLDDPRLMERLSRDLNQTIDTSLERSNARPSATSATESATASPVATVSLKAFG